jgi:hypothetical protein
MQIEVRRKSTFRRISEAFEGFGHAHVDTSHAILARVKRLIEIVSCELLGREAQVCHQGLKIRGLLRELGYNGAGLSETICDDPRGI